MDASKPELPFGVNDEMKDYILEMYEKGHKLESFGQAFCAALGLAYAFAKDAKWSDEELREKTTEYYNLVMARWEEYNKQEN